MDEGTLVLVPTPLGRADDLSPRARRILETADYLACEDTRRAARLLSSLGIGNRLVSYYEQNAEQRHEDILRDLEQGRQTIAVITDAGTPCISDPGAALVNLAVERGIRVVSVPGPTAVVTALAASGLDPSRFVFDGFLPVKGRERREMIDAWANEPRTVVFFEAPHRLRRTLDDLAGAGLGDRRMTVARELTKPYEEYLHFAVSEAVRYYETVVPRGEFTLVLEGTRAHARRTGCEAHAADGETAREIIRFALEAGLKTKQAAQLAARLTGGDRRILYQTALDESDSVAEK